MARRLTKKKRKSLSRSSSVVTFFVSSFLFPPSQPYAEVVYVHLTRHYAQTLVDTPPPPPPYSDIFTSTSNKKTIFALFFFLFSVFLSFFPWAARMCMDLSRQAIMMSLSVSLSVCLSVCLSFSVFSLCRQKSGSRGSRNADKDKQIYVGALPRHATEEEVRAVFSSFGTITKVFHPKAGNSFLFLEYSTVDAAVRRKRSSTASTAFIQQLTDSIYPIYLQSLSLSLSASPAMRKGRIESNVFRLLHMQFSHSLARAT